MSDKLRNLKVLAKLGLEEHDFFSSFKFIILCFLCMNI